MSDQDIIVDTLDTDDSTNVEINVGDADLDSLQAASRRLNSKVNIYPNPSTGLIHIALDFVVAQDVEIVVHSALGVQVYEVSLQNVKEVIHDLDLRGQVSGMYLVGIIGTQDRFREQVWIE